MAGNRADDCQKCGGGLTLCFADDYAYDACADAIRDGCAYQIMAYTDETYSYSDVVFSGLQTYLRLDDGEMDDETFCREAAAHIDVPSLMRYTLLVQ